MTQQGKAFADFGSVLREQAERDPLRSAFTFLSYQGRGIDALRTSLTSGDLDVRARALAVQIQDTARPGDRAVLLFHPGLDFVVALMACFYAGVVAIPSAMLRFGLGKSRLTRIMEDSGARLILTTRASVETLTTTVADAGAVRFLCCDELHLDAAADWRGVQFDRAAAAVLQYSSGSTGQPKGVLITHANLIHQAEVIRHSHERLRLAKQSGAQDAAESGKVVSWLPAFHDMGLVFGILHTLYRGYGGVLMAPDAFVQRPIRWLRAIHEFGADWSVAPNFAYDLCTRAIPVEELVGLDLSSWKYAGNAAEPVRASTLERFTERFAPFGFNHDSWLPMFGLAEATLTVTARQERLRIAHVDALQLAENRVVEVAEGSPSARALVSCGHPAWGCDVRIVDPQRLAPVAAGEVGEIWVAGGSVGQGYHGNAAQTQETFAAQCADEPGRTYLRTGDLGFDLDGEIYVCGRLKDLILIRGANHHAPDIEATVEAGDVRLKSSGCAAFSIEGDDEERLVIVAELERAPETLTETILAEIAAAIRSRVAEAHQISVYALALVSRGVPRTSSGKVQRFACRRKFLNNELTAKYLWRLDPGEKRADAAPAANADVEAEKQRFLDLLVSEVASLVGPRVSLVAGDTRPADLGIDGAIEAKIKEFVDRTFDVALQGSLLVYETLRDLAAHVSTARRHGRIRRGLSVEQLQAAGRVVPVRTSEPIAIVGMACRFPGANGPGEFWENLCNGVDSVGEVPEERWRVDGVFDANAMTIGKMNNRHGGFLRNLEYFDRHFFDCSTREAVRMDPAHRLIAEVSWESLEDAGILPNSLSETMTGVFVGISGSDYAQLQFAEETMADAFAGLGCALTNTAARVAHFLNLRGPALALDTACSSSLTAIHMGCNAIRNGDCEMALAGGVNIILSPSVTMSLSKAGMLAPDGRCKAFDESANGYVRSEGAGMVLLKPLSRALEDGNPIYAVVRGSASNHDGHSSALAVPNGEAQQRVVMAACASAGIAPGQLDYVEAHGTGTPVGDPIEVNALGEVLRIGALPGRTARIGSVKTNIGHTESAAGVASVIKAAMMLKHRELVPSLHFNRPNPKIDFEALGVRVQTRHERVDETHGPMRVGVNSFGIGGTNVHLVLEAHGDASHAAVPLVEPAGDADEFCVMALSAKTPAALKSMAQAMSDHLTGNRNVGSLRDVCHTSVFHRARMEHRVAVVARNKAELAERLEVFASVNQHADVATGRSRMLEASQPRLVFVFAGHGAQWHGMGRQLMDTEPAYREALQRCDAALAPHTGWSLLEFLARPDQEALLEDTGYAQPVIFACQCALVALWSAWGIRPDAVVGHSLGEIAAAYAAGALSMEVAAQLVAARARFMRAGKPGRMANIDLPAAELAGRLVPHGDALSLAAINGPSACVVSGEVEVVERFLEAMQAEGIDGALLKVKYAFHTAAMDGAKGALVAAMSAMESRPPRIAFASTVSGDFLDSAPGAAYWGENLREPIKFLAAIETLLGAGFSHFIEISPHPVFSRPIARLLQASGKDGLVLSSLQRREPEAKAVRAAFAALHTHGIDGDWAAMQPGGRFCSGLPTYRWDRQRYWLDDAIQRARQRLTFHPLLTTRLPLAYPAWQSMLDQQTVPFLGGERINQRAAFPNGVLLEMAVEAARVQRGARLIELTDIRVSTSMSADSASGVHTLQVITAEESDERAVVHITADGGQNKSAAERWHVALTARNRAAGAEPGRRLDLAQIKERNPMMVDATATYQRMAEIGIIYHPQLKLVHKAWVGEHESLIELRADWRAGATDSRYNVHPLLFEAAGQSIRIALGVQAVHSRVFAIDRIRMRVEAAELATRAAHVLVRPQRRSRNAGAQAAASFKVDAQLVDGDGDVLLEMDGVQLRICADGMASQAQIPSAVEQWRFGYQWQPSPLEGAIAAQRDGGTWVLFADEHGYGDALEWELRNAGGHVVTVRAGRGFAQLADDSFEVGPDSVADVLNVLRIVQQRPASVCVGLVHCWSVNVRTDGAALADSGDIDISLTTLSVAALVQATALLGSQDRPRLWVVTAGAQAVGVADAPVQVGQTPVWGLGKGIAIEHPELRCCRVDLSPQLDPIEIAGLSKTLLVDGPEDQLAFRCASRYSARLVPLAGSTPAGEPDASVAAERHYRVVVPAGDAAGSVALTECARVRPARGQIEVCVHAAVIPSGSVQSYQSAASSYQAELTGITSLGVVSAVGPGVQGLKVGDRVVAVHEHVVGSHVVVPRTSAVAVGDEARAAESLGSVRSLQAALFALRHIAGVKTGNTVFVHGAEGTQGKAVIQIARALGARVYVSVEDPSDYRRIAHSGVTHAFDRFDPSMLQQLMTLTDDRGVDVLVNCVGDYDLNRLLPALALFGRCLDLAPGDAQAGAETGRLRLPKNSTWHSIDLAGFEMDAADLYQQVLQEVGARLENGHYIGMPQRLATPDTLLEALRSRSHQPVVLHLPQAERAAASGEREYLRSVASYLITGGLGGLGLNVARKLAEQGARHLVLVGRRAPSLATLDTLAEIEQLGAQVSTFKVDIGNAAEVGALIKTLDDTVPPIRGVIHAAGVLDNGLLAQLTAPQFVSVASAKMQGAWHLHRALADRELDFFVMFSSLASAIGSPGQSNYSAANAFLDGLAEHRRAQGRAGLSIAWGPWAEAGMAADVHTLGRLAEHGMGMIGLDAGLGVLEDLLVERRQGALAILPMNWGLWGRSFPLLAKLPYFAAVIPAQSRGEAGGRSLVTAQMLRELNVDEQLAVLGAVINREVSHIMRVDAGSVDATVGLTELGLDSILALELKSRLEASVDVVVQTFALLRGQSIEELARQVRETLLAPANAAAAAPATAAAAMAPESDLPARIDDLSDSEALALLAELREARTES